MWAVTPVKTVATPISNVFGCAGAGVGTGAGAGAGWAQPAVIIAARITAASIDTTSLLIFCLLTSLYDVRPALSKLFFDFLIGKTKVSLEGVELQSVPLFVLVVELAAEIATDDGGPHPHPVNLMGPRAHPN